MTPPQKRPVPIIEAPNLQAYPNTQHEVSVKRIENVWVPNLNQETPVELLNGGTVFEAS